MRPKLPRVIQALERCGRSESPCSHLFSSLTKSSRNGVVCQTWFVARPGWSAVELRISIADAMRIVRVQEVDGPLWLEDDFPISFARIRGGRYELLDRTREVISARGHHRADGA